MVSSYAARSFTSLPVPTTPPSFGNVENRNEQPNPLASAILGPRGTSFWLGAYTPIPAPPPQARIQMGLETTGLGDVMINYLMWDKDANRFKRQDVHYSAFNGLFKTNSFEERGGFVQDIRDGEMLYGGVIVDQKNGKLLLNGGGTMDGPTGNVFDQHGNLIKRFREEEVVPTVYSPQLSGTGNQLAVSA